MPNSSREAIRVQQPTRYTLLATANMVSPRAWGRDPTSQASIQARMSTNARAWIAEEVAPYGQELILKTDTRPLPSLSALS
ncbi:hypothetical protein CCHR01_13422 [Colletotrichum chrysophilum]|uniref:Uncharacterized protein n=1 Tax=Colletotrichum chrysophilum TaxID=1836956 RepID=A0AAD9EGI2_9PEZI|nr:hypothetical protein CCHR01_13422 [Colletotrichum chrysophilum]